MSIITADAATPPTNPSNGSGGCAVTSNTTLYLDPTGSTGFATAAAATTAAASFLSGDQILLVKSDGSQYTTVKLTAAGSTATVGANRFVVLTHTATTTSGSTTGFNSAASGNDPYSMTTNVNSMMSEQYCSTDYVLRILPIQYSVDLTNPSDPALIRTVAGAAQTLSQKTLATQIIGLKIGASLFNNTLDTDTTTYSFDSSSYNNGTAVPFNYTLVRSIMVSLIGRTAPTTDPNYVFRNSFDSGAYEIQGVSTVINPRNMSMNN